MIQQRRLHLALWMLLLPLATGLAAAQKELPGVFGEIIEVRVVNIEVVVTDKNGVRVSGLGPEVFQLWVDGEKVPIDFFTEVLGGDAIASESAATAEVPAVEPGRPVGTSYLVFIDESFTLPVNRNRVLRGLIDQLSLLGPQDRMAVVAYDGRQLEMLSTWSQSISHLARTLEGASRRPAFGAHRIAERRSFAATRFRSSGAGPGSSSVSSRLDVQEIAYANRLSDQLSRTILAAAATLRSFASPPGRKVLLLLAGGWPFRIEDFVVNDFTRLITDDEVPSGPDVYRPLVENANRLGYTIYPIDVPGVQTEAVSVEETSPGAASSFAGAPDDGAGGPGSTTLGATRISGLRERDIHAALDFLAEETGGRALLNAGRNRPLDTVVADTRSYYWLGYTPDWQGNDQRHDIRVEVNRPGLKVRTRGSYVDLSRQAEVSMMVESALLFGNPPSSRPLPVKLGRPRKAGRGKMEVPITLAIPVDIITLLRRQGTWVGRLELRVAALDDSGDRSQIPVIPIEVSGDQRPAPGKYIRYDTSLKLRRQPHELVIAIVDQASGSMLSTKVEVDPGR